MVFHTSLANIPSPLLTEFQSAGITVVAAPPGTTANFSGGIGVDSAMTVVSAAVWATIAARIVAAGHTHIAVVSTHNDMVPAAGIRFANVTYRA